MLTIFLVLGTPLLREVPSLTSSLSLHTSGDGELSGTQQLIPFQNI